MTDKADILLLEDSCIDADLVAEHLRLAGIEHELTCVWTREDFVDALQSGRFDLILADYSLPAFDGLSALGIAREMRPDLPFIFVSGTLGEDVAVDALKDGATDYVVKTRMKRLGPAASRALAEVAERRARSTVEGELDRSRLRLDAALEIAGLGTFEWDLDSGKLSMDARARDILAGDAASVEALIARVEASERPALRAALEEGIAARQRTERSFSLPVGPDDLRDVTMICDVAEDGRTAYGVVFDVTTRRAAERQQELILRELHHRVKNSLASVQSIINFTLRTSEGMEDFSASVRRRIRSLAASHTLLTDRNWTGIELSAVLMGELSPYTDVDRVELNGPPLHLPADMALTLALAIHEMTTNAAKYGALSSGTGRVTASWGFTEDRQFRFEWKESGGPKVFKPTRRGFGSILLEQALGDQLNGSVEQCFHPEGVQIRITAPAPAA